MLIGFDVGGTKIEGAVFDGTGCELMRRRQPTPRHDYDASIELIASMVRSFESSIGAQASVGLGIPGSLSPFDGRVRNANSTWLNGRPLKRDLESALGRSVRIENDANCLAVSEAADGAARDASVVFAVILGTGCGAGVAVDGRAIRGRNAVAGEFGHNPLPWAAGRAEAPGPSCWCGKRGCVESYLSGTGFAERYAEATGRTLSAEAIVNAARDGDSGARKALETYRDRLARTLAAVVNLLDPDVIVLGGGMSNIDELYPGLTEALARFVFSDACDTPVVRAAHGDSSGVRGAAWLWR